MVISFANFLKNANWEEKDSTRSAQRLSTLDFAQGRQSTQRRAQRGIAVQQTSERLPAGSRRYLCMGRYPGWTNLARMSFVSASALAIWVELKLWVTPSLVRAARTDSVGMLPTRLSPAKGQPPRPVNAESKRRQPAA